MIKECETVLSVIPTCLVWRLQLIEINVHKIFLKNKYVCYWISKNNIKGSKSAITEWIDELWYSDSGITNEMIFNSFKYSGISNS